MAQATVVLVAGAGGFIGGHIIRALIRSGNYQVRAVDSKPLADWHQQSAAAETLRLNLKDPDACRDAVRDAQVVINLAADMGGMGFIETHKADCMLSVLI